MGPGLEPPLFFIIPWYLLKLIRIQALAQRCPETASSGRLLVSLQGELGVLMLWNPGHRRSLQWLNPSHRRGP